jgi:hypothetical protein
MQNRIGEDAEACLALTTDASGAPGQQFLLCLGQGASSGSTQGTLQESPRFSLLSGCAVSLQDQAMEGA